MGDDDIWQILENSKDEAICKLIDQIKNPKNYFYLVQSSNLTAMDASCIKGFCKFRGCNPLVGNSVREVKLLTDINSNFKQVFYTKKSEMSSGFQIRSSVNVAPLTVSGAKIIDSYGVVPTTKKK